MLSAGDLITARTSAVSDPAFVIQHDTTSLYQMHGGDYLGCFHCFFYFLCIYYQHPLSLFQTLVKCTSNGSTVFSVSHTVIVCITTSTPPSCIKGVGDLQRLHQTCSLGIYSCCPSNYSLLESGVAQPFVHLDGQKRKFVCFTLKLAPLRR